MLLSGLYGRLLVWVVINMRCVGLGFGAVCYYGCVLLVLLLVYCLWVCQNCR